MIKFSNIRMPSNLIAGLGALMLSSVCIGAAIAPAQAQTPAQDPATCLLVSHA